MTPAHRDEGPAWLSRKVLSLLAAYASGGPAARAALLAEDARCYAAAWVRRSMPSFWNRADT